MIRRIIRIDEGKCTGCGRCAEACHEGAIGMVDGKARLLRDDCCDGLGDCLPSCPAGAISFEEREARPYDEEAVKSLLRRAQVVIQATSLGLKPGDPSPVPPERLACNPHLRCFDTIYQETPFLQGAAALGLPVSDGRAMLLYQGAKSLEIWTGRIAPLEAMRAALERSLQK